MKQLLTILLAVCCLSACKQERKSFSAPVSDLGHVDLVLDSAAFHAILQDSFLTNQFAIVFQDTTQYSKPSYDIYMLGGEAFLHISLATEYWENKAGSGVMIFQTRRPGNGDSLLLSWRQFFKDSLNATSFKGSDFNTSEILPYRKKDSLKPAEPNFTPILTSYSTQAYKNWDFSDTQINDGISMREFMLSWDSSIQSKLFKKIKVLHIQLTQQEFTETESALYAMGYTKQGSQFIHEFNPLIYYQITETNAVPKYSRIEIELNEPTAERTIQLGDTYEIKVKNTLLVIQERGAN